MQAGADRDLIEASRGGDRAAFAQLIERHQRAVYAVAFATTRDRTLADDVAQDAFVTAWRRLGELRDPDRLPAWLCGIARNVARDARKRVRPEVHEDVDDVIASGTPYDAISDAECERVVAAALGELPEQYREPLVLFYYEERSLDDVARYLGLSTATTQKRLSRGRQQLADRVALFVERGIPRRGARATLAASVLALIGVTVPASHVDASPAPKGSTMHKLALAATLTAVAAGGTIAIVTATRTSDAEASASHATTSAPTDTPHHMHMHGTAGTPSCAHRAGGDAPALPALLHSARRERTAVPAGATDCAAVGNHLASLESQTGTSNEPSRCAADYAAICEKEGWPLDRRICALGADDLMNAHLCAFAQQGSAQDTDVPPALACSAVAAHVTPIIQGAGMYADVPDFAQQIEDACEAGAWSTDLRQCFVSAQAIDSLHACVQ
ncbi:MAG: sigma-70 family RNA polymerase sigma factor [Deltaproteobacteria bacterium]|nr:sigma-70 family RNA polymerase sigma factor [Deltaproteobacteria bacterium]